MIDIDAGLVERLLLELARDGAHGETGVWRTAYSPEWVAAQDRVAGWMEEAGKPSRVTESSYRNVMAEWPYRRSLDCVAEVPDGRFASYVLVRPDDENGVGLFEPVGTRAEFRRRGLGAAVCTFGLRRLHEEGMRRAVVGCDTERACALYESLGSARDGSSAANGPLTK